MQLNPPQELLKRFAGELLFMGAGSHPQRYVALVGVGLALPMLQAAGLVEMTSAGDPTPSTPGSAASTEQFLFETSCATSNDELIRSLVCKPATFYSVHRQSLRFKQVKVWNARIRLSAISYALDELAKYGPAKPEDLRGLSDVSFYR
jgi:hypothetical protein